MTQAKESIGNWGRWGDDDERGTLNLLTPEVVRAAAGSIKSGKVYNLGLPIQQMGMPTLDYRNPPMRPLAGAFRRRGPVRPVRPLRREAVRERGLPHDGLS